MKKKLILKGMIDAKSNIIWILKKKNGGLPNHRPKNYY